MKSPFGGFYAEGEADPVHHLVTSDDSFQQMRARGVHGFACGHGGRYDAGGRMCNGLGDQIVELKTVDGGAVAKSSCRCRQLLLSPNNRTVTSRSFRHHFIGKNLKPGLP